MSVFIEKVKFFAQNCHKNEVRKSGAPYYSHPLAVYKRVRSLGIGVRAESVALLHDVLENGGANFEEVREQFGKDIANMVLYLSKKSKKSYFQLEHNIEKNIPLKKTSCFNDDPELYAKRTSDYIKRIEKGATRYPEILIIKMCDQLDNLEDCFVFSIKKYTRIIEAMTLLYIPLYQEHQKNIPENLKLPYAKLFNEFKLTLKQVRSEHPRSLRKSVIGKNQFMVST